jgi:Mn-dependent DtxR family transcriptional regulator
LCNRNNKRLTDKGKKTRIKEIERQLHLTGRIFAVTPDDPDTNEEKAEKLREALRESDITTQEICSALKILDKYHYAPAGSIETEEVEELYVFFTKYTADIYRNGKNREKFIYKYIKCLYLSDK